ncbi:MAG TPA: hypothetical protein VJT72_02875 [Pseudonocardiaceae bacterium]|nr:hypothetical protein [Pseudonocardiaceae bacterium]
MSAAATACAAAIERRATDMRTLPWPWGAPNIVPGNTSALYDPRASDDESLQQRKTRLPASFSAEALATGYTHEVTQVSRLEGPYRQLVRLQRHRLIGSGCRCRVARAPAAGGAV